MELNTEGDFKEIRRIRWRFCPSSPVGSVNLSFCLPMAGGPRFLKGCVSCCDAALASGTYRNYPASAVRWNQMVPSPKANAAPQLRWVWRVAGMG